MKSRCKAYIPQFKRCKKSAHDYNEYCHHHVNQSLKCIPVMQRRNMSVQTDQEIEKKGRCLSMCLFLFYFLIYLSSIGCLVVFKVRINEKM